MQDCRMKLRASNSAASFRIAIGSRESRVAGMSTSGRERMSVESDRCDESRGDGMSGGKGRQRCEREARAVSRALHMQSGVTAQRAAKERRRTADDTDSS